MPFISNVEELLTVNRCELLYVPGIVLPTHVADSSNFKPGLVFECVLYVAPIVVIPLTHSSNREKARTFKLNTGFSNLLLLFVIRSTL